MRRGGWRAEGRCRLAWREARRGAGWRAERWPAGARHRQLWVSVRDARSAFALPDRESRLRPRRERLAMAGELSLQAHRNHSSRRAGCARTTRTRHPSAEIDSSEAVTGGCGCVWLYQRRQPPHEVRRRHHQVRGAVSPRCLELELHLPAGVGLQRSSDSSGQGTRPSRGARSSPGSTRAAIAAIRANSELLVVAGHDDPTPVRTVQDRDSAESRRTQRGQP